MIQLWEEQKGRRELQNGVVGVEVRNSRGGMQTLFFCVFATTKHFALA